MSNQQQPSRPARPALLRIPLFRLLAINLVAQGRKEDSGKAAGTDRGSLRRRWCSVGARIERRATTMEAA